MDRLSAEEERLVRQLSSEIEEHFQRSVRPVYEFEPFSTGAGEFTDRVKREVVARARKVGWVASDLDQHGVFTVRKP